MNKQAQIQHVFGFILAAIVIVAILVMGTFFVTTILNQGCEAEDHRLTNKLLEISNVYDSYGTRQTVSISAPCNAEKICFINQDTTKNLVLAYAGISGAEQQQLALATELPEPKPNAFLIRDGALIELGTYDKIRVKDVLCINRKLGDFPMLVEGKGRTILLNNTPQ